MGLEKKEVLQIRCDVCEELYELDYIPYYNNKGDALDEIEQSDWTWHGDVIHCPGESTLCRDLPLRKFEGDVDCEECEKEKK